MPNGDIYFHRYNHDNYGESNERLQRMASFGRQTVRAAWPVLSGERGQYEIANGRSAAVYLQSMADAANDGYLRAGAGLGPPGRLLFCVGGGRTGSAAPLNWAEGQYLRLAQSIDAATTSIRPRLSRRSIGIYGLNRGKGGKCISADASANNATAVVSTCNGASEQNWTWMSGDGTLRVLDKCMDAAGGGSANGARFQLRDCNGAPAQEWRWRKQGRLENPQSGRCLDASGDGTGDGTQLQLWGTATILVPRLGSCPKRSACGRLDIYVMSKGKSDPQAKKPQWDQGLKSPHQIVRPKGLPGSDSTSPCRHS